MNNQSEIVMNKTSVVCNLISLLFGIAVLAVGLLNIFIVLSIIIIWASFGVGELFHKLDLMLMDL